MPKDKWIQGAIEHRGALHKDLGIPEDKSIPEKMLREAAKRKDKTGQRARLAMTLKGMHHDGAKKKITSLKELSEKAKDMESKKEDMED